MNKCAYQPAWTDCQNEAESGERFCSEHGEKKCWCGQQATHECGIAVSLVCGQPLCDDHECCFRTHSEHGHEQFIVWKNKGEHE